MNPGELNKISHGKGEEWRLRYLRTSSEKVGGILNRHGLLTNGLIRQDFFSGLNQICALVIFCLACLSLLLVCLMESKPYQLLFLLPLTFILGYLFFIWKKLNVFSGIGILFIHLTFFIRMAVIPAMMCLGRYGSKVSLQIYQANIDKAIILMVYEFILVFAAIIIYSIYKKIKIPWSGWI